MENRLLTVRETAERLRISRSSVYGLIRKGTLRAVCPSLRRTRIRLYDLENYLERNATQKLDSRAVRAQIETYAAAPEPNGHGNGKAAPAEVNGHGVIPPAVLAMRLLGYEPGPPSCLSAKAQEEEARMAAGRECPACHQLGLTYKPFHNGPRYHAIAVCPECSHALEL